MGVIMMTKCEIDNCDNKIEKGLLYKEGLFGKKKKVCRTCWEQLDKKFSL